MYDWYETQPWHETDYTLNENGLPGVRYQKPANSTIFNVFNVRTQKFLPCVSMKWFENRLLWLCGFVTLMTFLIQCASLTFKMASVDNLISGQSLTRLKISQNHELVKAIHRFRVGMRWWLVCFCPWERTCHRIHRRITVLFTKAGLYMCYTVNVALYHIKVT